MNDKLAEQGLKMLQQLAEKMGTTAEKLWAILVHGVWMDGVINAIWAVLILAVLIPLVIAVVRAAKRLAGVNYEDWDEGILVGGGIVSVILLIAFAVAVNEALSNLLNTDYVALQKLLELLTGAK